MKKAIWGFGFLTVLSFSACKHPAIFDKDEEIVDGSWLTTQKPKFEVEIEDSLQNTNVYINIRNSSCYPYRNILLFINTTFPDGKVARDTLECMLADDTGRWLGDGLGDIWDNRILFKKNVRFPQRGIYKFEFEQAMRLDPLPCIMDIGMRVEKK